MALQDSLYRSPHLQRFTFTPLGEMVGALKMRLSEKSYTYRFWLLKSQEISLYPF